MRCALLPCFDKLRAAAVLLGELRVTVLLCLDELRITCLDELRITCFDGLRITCFDGLRITALLDKLRIAAVLSRRAACYCSIVS